MLVSTCHACTNTAVCTMYMKMLLGTATDSTFESTATYNYTILLASTNILLCLCVTKFRTNSGKVSWGQFLWKANL